LLTVYETKPIYWFLLVVLDEIVQATSGGINCWIHRAGERFFSPSRSPRAEGDERSLLGLVTNFARRQAKPRRCPPPPIADGLLRPALPLKKRVVRYHPYAVPVRQPVARGGHPPPPSGGGGRRRRPARGAAPPPHLAPGAGAHQAALPLRPQPRQGAPRPPGEAGARVAAAGHAHTRQAPPRVRARPARAGVRPPRGPTSSGDSGRATTRAAATPSSCSHSAPPHGRRASTSTTRAASAWPCCIARTPAGPDGSATRRKASCSSLLRLHHHAHAGY
jgi:hypothetical protein